MHHVALAALLLFAIVLFAVSRPERPAPRLVRRSRRTIEETEEDGE